MNWRAVIYSECWWKCYFKKTLFWHLLKPTSFNMTLTNSQAADLTLFLCNRISKHYRSKVHMVTRHNTPVTRAWSKKTIDIFLSLIRADLQNFVPSFEFRFLFHASISDFCSQVLSSDFCPKFWVQIFVPSFGFRITGRSFESSSIKPFCRKFFFVPTKKFRANFFHYYLS